MARNPRDQAPILVRRRRVPYKWVGPEGHREETHYGLWQANCRWCDWGSHLTYTEQDEAIGTGLAHLRSWHEADIKLYGLWRS